MIAAIDFGFSQKAARTASMSLNGTEIVSAANWAGTAGAVRPAVSERSASGLDEQRIDVPVIAALELDDFVAAGESARESQAGHRRFGPAVDHSHFLDRRNPAANQLGHLDFQRVGNAEADPARGRGADGVDHDRRGVAENGRAPGADVVEVLFAVDVPDSRTLSALDEEWVAAQAAKSADGRIDAAGDALQGG